MLLDRGLQAETIVRGLLQSAGIKSNTKPETVVRELFELAGIGIDGGSRGDIVIHDERFYERLLRDKSIGLGESYMDGWWETDALDVFIEKVLRADLKRKMADSWRLKLLGAQALLFNRQGVEKARASIAVHYDIGNDLYERMLDPRMVYTCAYWKDASTLAQAQEAKLDLVCRKVGLEPGMRVLDLGCGWGGFALYAAEKYGCEVVGVTVSAAQAQLGQERAKASGLPVEIQLADYREARGRYDRVVSIGMMEHIGPKNYRTVMEIIRKTMVDDGVALIHTIANNRSVNHGTPFVEKYIFPNAVAPSLAQLARAVEGTFVIEDVQNIGPDYDPTLMAWWDNFVAAYPDLDAKKYDQRFYRMWQFYLLGAAGASRSRDGQLYHLVLTKVGRKQPDCRKS
ncbi:cyclopropane fatty acyl phospholipid synthase [Paraliomyxa miuraensis]|uniref:cyclopropane fatty acyl phospholipid synthase n=1 Tax=Paraliomyxa miuraensis TaxID=376150 RepID=UPI002258CAEA|nr:cyclopropane fatty acyl phospholipid synthase [Paraliomyxa miuraensis]MCX4239294.1 cyclopropane fatty acyl phospholipid synthase [Paraliomyxa miuraensis]